MSLLQKIKNLFKDKCMWCKAPLNNQADTLCPPCREAQINEFERFVKDAEKEFADKAKAKVDRAEKKRRYLIDIIKQAIRELEQEKQNRIDAALEEAGL